MAEDEEALLPTDSPTDEFELFRASSYSGGVDILSQGTAGAKERGGTEDSSSGVSCETSPVIRSLSTYSPSPSASFTPSSFSHSTHPCVSTSNMLRHPRMRGLKLRKSKSDKDIVSEIRKLRHWTRKQESDERNSPEGEEEVNVCLLEETGDTSSTTSSKDLGHVNSVTNASIDSGYTNNSLSIDSTCDPDFEILTACKYKRAAQMVRMVSTTDSGIDIQVTAPSPVHKPSKAGGQFRRAYSCKGRTSSLYLGEGSRLPCKYLPQTLSDNHLDQHTQSGYQIYRVRSFSITNNAITNRGDSFKIRPPQGSKTGSKQRGSQQFLHPSSGSVGGSVGGGGSSRSHSTTLRAAIRRSYFSSDCIVSQAQKDSSDWVHGRTVSMERLRCDDDSYEEEDDGERDGEESGDEPDIPVFKVAVLGSHGVGKTTVTRQLLTSEYLQNASDVTQDEEQQSASVTVLLDDEESMLQFLDVAGEEANQCQDSMDAYIVVYSATDCNSFRYAHACLQDIRGDRFSNAVVILVANKQDLVRNKVVTEEEGKHLAVKFACKYIEVSAILDHKVSELLVGIVRQIRLQRLKHSRDVTEGSGDLLSYTGCLHRTAFELFRRIFRRSVTTSKSCDNLLV